MAAPNSPYHLAKGLLDHAEHRAAQGDPQEALRLAAEAELLAEGLKAMPLVDRARRLLDTYSVNTDTAPHDGETGVGQSSTPLLPAQQTAAPFR